ncbi:MAG: hypothetical protein Q7W51_05755 [Coriobacteriia bacterium]|nr:hypothetical protein [Coriobacteriia bacterium]
MPKPRPNQIQRLGFTKMTPEEQAELQRELALFDATIAGVPFEDDTDELADLSDVIAECINGVVADCIDANDDETEHQNG